MSLVGAPQSQEVGKPQAGGLLLQAVGKPRVEVPVLSGEVPA